MFIPQKTHRKNKHIAIWAMPLDQGMAGGGEAQKEADHGSTLVRLATVVEDHVHHCFLLLDHIKVFLHLTNPPNSCIKPNTMVNLRLCRGTGFM